MIDFLTLNNHIRPLHQKLSYDATQILTPRLQREHLILDFASVQRPIQYLFTLHQALTNFDLYNATMIISQPRYNLIEH